jgi:hypothetical protein
MKGTSPPAKMQMISPAAAAWGTQPKYRFSVEQNFLPATAKFVALVYCRKALSSPAPYLSRIRISGKQATEKRCPTSEAEAYSNPHIPQRHSNTLSEYPYRVSNTCFTCSRARDNANKLRPRTA